MEMRGSPVPTFQMITKLSLPDVGEGGGGVGDGVRKKEGHLNVGKIHTQLLQLLLLLLRTIKPISWFLCNTVCAVLMFHCVFLLSYLQ